MKVYRCRICGESYLGEESPDKCPFCGAERTFLIPGAKWTDENKDLVLSEITLNNLNEALQLEVNNSRFYLCAAKAAKDIDNELEGMFKRLSKVEREHASVICKMLRIDLPSKINEPLECSNESLDNVAESKRRETNAVGHYSKFLSEATEDRAKTVFGALIVIEKTHIELDEKEQTRLVKPV